jgi:serine/threonine protein kinase/Flp pilus assembly protein TadD
MTQIIGKTISHYRIIEEVGRGGMGVVYLAEDTKLERKVAIKFLPHNISIHSAERERLKIEAKAAASLNHNNIATIHSIEETDDEIFIVMEHIDGQELKKIINNTPIPVDEALRISQQIADGLAAAHSKGIVHRDIKSSNIMITEDGKVKIMDFGLAKVRGAAQVTKLGTTVGTAAYMSPEQARGEEVDQRTDIWSFGVLLCEMLTGFSPFKGDYENAIIYSILNEEPRFTTKLPLELEQVVLKMLAKDPAQRYQHMEEVLQSFRNIDTQEDKDAPKITENSIAVLPFENISPDKDADYFADGLAEELIVNLTKIRDLRVISRTTALRYKGTNKDIKTIGKGLGTMYVMTGSVRKFQDNLRISVQLINAHIDTQQWAETYKGKLEDVFDIQENVSKQIVDALRIELTPTQKKELEKRATVNHEAFDLYLRAKGFLYKLTKKDVKISIDLFQKAIQVDPHYASAYAGLSEAYMDLYDHFERTENLLTQAQETALKALSMDSSLSDAHATLAQAYLHKDLSEKAYESGKKAIELDPNSFVCYWILGRIYFSNGKNAEALELHKRAAVLNPDFYTAYSDIRMCYEKLGLKEKAKEAVTKALEFYPGYLDIHPDDARAHLFYAMDLVQAEKIDEAKKEAAKALELNPNDSLMQYNAACFYSAMGEKQHAIETLKKAIVSGWQAYQWLKSDPDFDNIRNEPEFIELMKGK